MSTAARTKRKSFFPAGPGGKIGNFRPLIFWILAALLCLSLFAPGWPVFAGRLSGVTAPVVDTKVDLNLRVSTTAVINSSFLHASQDGKLPSELVFTLVRNVTQGMLKLNGEKLGTGATFTQQDLNSGLLTYTAAASAGTNQFLFKVSDGVKTSAYMVYTIHVTKPEPSAYPTNFNAVAEGTGQITTTWTDIPGDAAPDGYLVVCIHNNSFPQLPADTDMPVNNSSCTDTGASVHVPQGVGTFTWQGLHSDTTYSFEIFPYAQTDYLLTPGAFFDYYTAPDPPTANAMTFLTYGISGRILGSDFQIMGARIDAGGGHITYSDEDGAYALTGLVPGDYVLSVSYPCYDFTALSSPVTISDGYNHVSGVDFNGTPVLCIRGTVTDGSHPLVGAVISDGSGHTGITLEDGSYTLGISGVPILSLETTRWSGELAPALPNYTFTPDRHTYTDISENQYDQNYVGVKLAVFGDRFMAAWGSVPGAAGYNLDVATDAGFTRFVPGYQNKDVGSVTEFEVKGLAPRTHYFYRVNAYNDLIQPVGTSTPTEVLTHWAYFFPMITQP